MKINQTYKDFVLGSHPKYSILYGGSGSGKSHSIVQYLILQCLTRNLRILVLRKTGVSLKESVIALFKSVLEDAGIPYTYRASFRDMKIGNSTVIFSCIDDPERIKSIHDIHICWLEEATEFTPDDFNQLVLRLRSLDYTPEFILSFNPIHQLNWVYRYFFDTSSPEYYLEGKDYNILKTTYRDNAFLPISYIDDLRSLKKTNPTYYQIYAEGDWGALGKLIFPRGTWTQMTLSIPSNAKYIDGLDLGWNDPNGLACSAVWDNILYTYFTWSESECTADKIAKVIRDNCRSRTVYADNAAAAQIAELNKLGLYNVIPNSKPPGSVLASINTIKAYDWYIDPSCTGLLKELDIYSWKKDPKSGLYLDEPERGSGETHVNIIDGVRYSLQGLGSTAKALKYKLPKGI